MSRQVHPLIRKAQRRSKLPKASHKGALITLLAIAELGMASSEEIIAHLKNRRASHETFGLCIDLLGLGLLDGHGQHPTMARGIPHKYSLTALGAMLVAWAQDVS